MKGTMRRKDKAMVESETLRFLEGCQVGRLGTSSADGMPYITPVNYIYHMGNIYFHCALEGHKLENIRENNNVCFEVDELLSIIQDENPCEMSAHYRSAVVFGRAYIVTDDETRVDVLKKLVDKYASHTDASSKLHKGSMAGTCIVEIKPDIITGKESVK